MSGESSKKAEKRIRKEREAIIAAAMDERRNPSFRILDECSTSPHVESHDMEGVVDSTQVPKKKTRGASKLKIHDKGKQKCDEINFNERNQLVGPEGQIALRDPKSKVHHATLGLLCWKVWVNHVIVNVPLFRSTREMYDLQDAIGSTVAWPSQFILLD